MPRGTNPVLAVVGPTASGKSDLAIELAKSLDGEIVSADSMQIYKGMDIGTAKVPLEKRVVKHYGIDLVDPGEPYSAALFQTYARSSFESISDRGKLPILCGGTGFYVRAALDDYDFAEGEQVGNAVRDAYQAMLAEKGPDAVWGELYKVDPESAEKVHANDSKRVIRALEMKAAGESYARRAEALKSVGQCVPATLVGIEVDRDVLNARIDRRVDAMREAGLVDEVKGLLDRGFREGVTARHAIGYKEVAAAIDGEMSMDEAFDRIKLATRRYAKRQRTWFRGDSRVIWIDGNVDSVDDMLDQALEKSKQATNGGSNDAGICKA